MIVYDELDIWKKNEKIKKCIFLMVRVERCIYDFSILVYCFIAVWFICPESPSKYL
jgi:hypothetical protein